MPLKNYVSMIETELKKTQARIVTAERQVIRLKEILSKPEFYFEKEKKNNSLRYRISIGEVVDRSNRTTFKAASKGEEKKISQNEKGEEKEGGSWW